MTLDYALIKYMTRYKYKKIQILVRDLNDILDNFEDSESLYFVANHFNHADVSTFEAILCDDRLQLDIGNIGDFNIKNVSAWELADFKRALKSKICICSGYDLLWYGCRCIE